MSRAVRAVVGIGLIVAGYWAGPWVTAAGISMLGGAVFEQRPRPFGRSSSEQIVMVRSGTEPQPVIYGRVKKSGPLLWFGSSGDLKEYLWYAPAVPDDRELEL